GGSTMPRRAVVTLAAVALAGISLQKGGTMRSFVAKLLVVSTGIVLGVALLLVSRLLSPASLSPDTAYAQCDTTTTTTLPPCGPAAAPTCGGDCLGAGICVATTGSGLCSCLSPPIPCDGSCGLKCAAIGQICDNIGGVC